MKNVQSFVDIGKKGREDCFYRSLRVFDIMVDELLGKVILFSYKIRKFIFIVYRIIYLIVQNNSEYLFNRLLLWQVLFIIYFFFGQIYVVLEGFSKQRKLYDKFK